MKSGFNITQYMTGAIEKLIAKALKATLKNPRESAFLLRFVAVNNNSSMKRKMFEESGTHIPPFLIASITSNCNLFCKGCYARANNACGENNSANQLTAVKWGNIFAQASDLGISFILLAGGEPFMRKDIIEKASEYKNIIFPIFTNGTMINDDYLKLFDKHRNLIPILSIEGNKEQTDSRRGEGTYDKLINAMDSLNKRGIFFGTSVTLTTENIDYVSSDAFVSDVYKKGGKLVLYIEYVPATPSTEHLAPTDKEREYLEKREFELHLKYDDMIILSFPGNEKKTGGCLAAGRGFFHINSSGGAEPCPFSPFSDTNLNEVTLIEALNSPLFKRLNSSELLKGSHNGGCVLFENEELVKSFLSI